MLDRCDDPRRHPRWKERGATLALGIGLAFSGLQGATLAAVSIIGSMITSVIDQKLIFPALFPMEPIKGQRLDDLELQAASEGAVINNMFGPTVRSTGQIIYLTNLKEVEESVASPGKGGGNSGGEVTNYRYFCDVAVGICDATYRPASKILKVWADGKVIYDDDPDLSIVNATSVSMAAISFPGTAQTTTFASGAGHTVSVPAGSDFDLSQIVVGETLIMAGWSNATNNGSFEVVESSRNMNDGSSQGIVNRGGTLGTPTYPGGFPVNETGATVTFTQDLPEVMPGTADAVTFYNGSPTQAPDPILQGHEGTISVPGYRGLCYIVIDELNLTDYGNRLPQFSFLVERDASPYTNQEAITDIMTLAGRDASEYDVTGLTGNLQGYATRGARTAVDMMLPILLASDGRMQQRGSELVFFQRDAAQSVSIATTDLGAHEAGGAPEGRPVVMTDAPTHALPSEVNVRYMDPNQDYQSGSQRERLRAYTTDEVLNVDLPIVMEPAAARTIALRMLWTAWANRQKFGITIPPSYLKTLENDLVTFTAYGQELTGIVDQVDRGSNWLMKCSGPMEAAQTLSYVGVSESGIASIAALPTPPNVGLQIIDFAPLEDAHATVPGFYFAMAITDPQLAWTGADLYRATSSGPPPAGYAIHATAIGEVTQGWANTVLAAGTTGIWDTANTVQITLVQGALSSQSELEVLNGANRMLVGDELIGFKTATLNSTLNNGSKVYTLSNLLRGLRNTEAKTGTHVVNERVVALNTQGISFSSFNTAWVGTTKWFKAVPTNAPQANYGAIAHVHVGGTIRPFGPHGMEGKRDSSNNLTLTWLRRSRAVRRLFATTPNPLLEPTEVYEIDVYSNSGRTTIVRTITVTSATTVVYTAAQQTTDGLTPGNTVYLTIYQLSATIGRGNPTEEAV